MAKSDATLRRIEILRRIRQRKVRVTHELVIQRILNLADRYQVKYQNVIRAVNRIGRHITLEQLAAVIATKNEAAIMAAIPWDSLAMPAFEMAIQSLTRELVVAAARTAERLLPGDLTFRFDLTNPLSVKDALEHGAKLVTQVSDETKQAIRQEIGRAIQEGRPPLTAARDIRSMIGLDARQQERLQTMREQGAQGTEIARARERMLQERSLRIARTETLWAANEGQTALWEQGVESGLIEPSARREFITTPDDRLCPVCEPLDGKLYGLDEPITTELGVVRSPPIHPNCRCTMSLVT